MFRRNNIPLTDHQRAELRRSLRLSYGANYAKKAGVAAGIGERQILRILAGRRGLTPRVARRLQIALRDVRPQAIECEIARSCEALKRKGIDQSEACKQARQLLDAQLARRPGI